MLDIGHHQGASLLCYTPQSSLRILAAVAQAQMPQAVETLWHMCASLQGMGYPVVVLDGSAVETQEAPGLINFLHQDPWEHGGRLHPGQFASSLTVIPSARGLAQLSAQTPEHGRSALHDLLPCFRAYGLMVLYAPVQRLARLLGRTQTSPLVFLQEGASQALASYQQCKQMTLLTGQACTVAALVRGATPTARKRAFATLRTLQDCADRHLGGQLHTTTIHAGHAADIQRLALQLLENAGALETGFQSLPTYDWMKSPAHSARSH